MTHEESAAEREGARDEAQDEAAAETNAHARDEAQQHESPADAQLENAEESDGYGY